MIYLIRSYGEKDSILKLGYTENLENRLESYFFHNPFVKLISTREGDEFLETLFHYYLKSLGYQFQIDGRLNEWFKDIPEVLSIFNFSQEEIENKLWENREKAFNPDKIISNNKGDFVIYEYLYNKNIDSFSGEEFIVTDDGKVIKQEIPLVDLKYSKIIGKKNKPIQSKKKENKLLSKIENKLGSEKYLEIEKEVSNFLDNQFYSTGIFREKMKMYCEFMDRHKNKYSQEFQDLIYFKIKDERFRKYYNFYGTSGCRAVRYEEISLKGGMYDVSKDYEIKISLHKYFQVGKKYTLKEIKFILTNLYRDLGISKKSKATDLDNYYKIKRSRLINPETKKLEEGYLIEDYK